MKEAIVLLVLLVSFSGCASSRNKRYAGWEYVRIEKQVPNSNCEYKIQEACNKRGSGCYNWFKQKAITYGANTVVITDMSKSQASKGSAVVFNHGGGAEYSSEEVMSALADYYFCPKEKKD